jgi:hypothetical protein
LHHHHMRSLCNHLEIPQCQYYLHHLWFSSVKVPHEYKVKHRLELNTKNKKFIIEINKLNEKEFTNSDTIE